MCVTLTTHPRHKPVKKKFTSFFFSKSVPIHLSNVYTGIEII